MRTLVTMIVLASMLAAPAAQEPTPEMMQEMLEQMMRRLEDAGLHSGPVIEGHGQVVPIPDPDVPTPTDHEYKVFFDVAMPEPLPEDLGGTHAVIDAAARFMNMHVEAGVPIENLRLAVMIYGPSTEAALGHEAYRARYGVDNPNVPLLEALAEAGAQIYLCGQTAAAFGVTPENKATPVQITLSAMTTLALLQADGYVKVH